MKYFSLHNTRLCELQKSMRRLQNGIYPIDMQDEPLTNCINIKVKAIESSLLRCIYE